jgi:hypothetical protein
MANVKQLAQIENSDTSLYPLLDWLLRKRDLWEVCGKLGFSPPIWHQTEMFIKKIKSSVDESTPERERSWIRGEQDRGDGIAVITDSAGLLSVLDDAESCFKNRPNAPRILKSLTMLSNFCEISVTWLREPNRTSGHYLEFD